MIQQKLLSIEDRTYRLIPMQPLNGLPFALKVAASLGSGIASLDAVGFSLSGLKPDEVDDASLEKALSAVIIAAANLDPTKTHELMREALNYEVYANDTKLSDDLHFNHWFDEHPGDLLPVAIWAIKEHVGRFFAKGGPAWSALAGQLGLSTSRQTAKANG
ncbi:phage tail assembly chaperone [Pseudomonas sp. GXZC]|uniref:phage tail assembly chaperone n=1 Tax=Pseudomonas sp. GXZC TaxID=3003351 RepID=UPI0022AA6D5E|nr:hypothetical protein [Pseudomonas sp. GXZC]WAT31815.1 hypothetical protein OZ428_16165 [Pseudomonas sp. GXZC]